MKKILGLHLGAAAIGWAFVVQPGEKERDLEFRGMGLKKSPLHPLEIIKYQQGKLPNRPAHRHISGYYPGYYRRNSPRLRKVLATLPGLPWNLNPKIRDERLQKDMLEQAMERKINLADLVDLFLYLNGRKDIALSVFDSVLERQQVHYPKILTEASRVAIRSLIRFRPRSSAPAYPIAPRCPLEAGMPVAPKSSPIVQVSEIWQALNLVTYRDKENEVRQLTQGQKEDLFRVLNRGEILNWRSACENIGLNYLENHPDRWTKTNGFPTNTTTRALRIAFEKYGLDPEDLLAFDLSHETRRHPVTGNDRLEIKNNLETQPLFRLWTLVLHAEDPTELKQSLMKAFPFNHLEAETISRIDFKTQGVASKSAKAYRRLLPYLMSGYSYKKACEAAGYIHPSNPKSEDGNLDFLERMLSNDHKNLDKVQASVLHELGLLLEELTDDPRFGKPDRIRVEISGELVHSAKERGRIFSTQTIREQDKFQIAQLLEEMGFRGSRKNIEKYTLWKSTDRLSPYSGLPVSLTGFLSSETADIDHIVPQSRLFDDSRHNKVVSEYFHNRRKGDMTASDYMQSIGEEEFAEFKARIAAWHKEGKIDAKKRRYFFMTETEIPDDLIDKSMHLDSKMGKAVQQLLGHYCAEVNGTAHSVTALLGRIWGWEENLKLLNLNAFKQAGKTYERAHPDGTTETRIMDIHWNHRFDLRHHSLDALLVACTRPSFIARLNYLNGEQGTSMRALESEFAFQKPFPAEEVMGFLEGC